jgi:hypothetical protein
MRQVGEPGCRTPRRWDHHLMLAGRRTVAALLVVLAAAATAGCGSGGGAKSTSAAADDPGPVPARSDLALPPNVPDRPTRPAAAEARRVIKAWLRALRSGDVVRASRYFAIPSKFQNSTPVLTIDSDLEREAVNRSLPCGAIATAMGAAGKYTIVTFRLTERPGGECGQGTGGTARSAIRVAKGKITEWYRLPRVPGGEQVAPPPPPTGPAV